MISSRAVLTVFVSSPLLVGDQSSLFEDVVQEDIHDDVVAGVDLTAHSLAAAHNML